MKESKQSSSRESKKSKQSREGTIPSGSRYQVLAHLENEGTIASPDTTMVTITENSAHDFVSPAKSRRDVFNGVIREANQVYTKRRKTFDDGSLNAYSRKYISSEVDSLTEEVVRFRSRPNSPKMAALTGRIQRLKEINSTKMFRESPKVGSEGTTSEIPVVVSEEVDLEVENNLGAENDSGIGVFGTTQGDCEDRQIKPGIDVDKGKGEAEEMISNSGRFFKLTSSVAPEAAICEERDKEKDEQKDDEEVDMVSSDADNAEAGKFCEKKAKEGEAQPRNSSDLERILMAYKGELAEEKKILDDDAKSDEQTSGEDEMGTEQGMAVVSSSVPSFDPKLSRDVYLVDNLDSGNKNGRRKVQFGEMRALPGQAPQVFDELPHQISETCPAGSVGENGQPFKKFDGKSQNSTEAQRHKTEGEHVNPTVGEPFVPITWAKIVSNGLPKQENEVHGRPKRRYRE
ncbi:hypothetical protein U1Q18_040802 [Sarracenia purpurea var. burkii]